MKNDKNENSGSLGKFENADELLSAYNALESEFTKRCQSLKRLQAELDGLRAQAENMRSADSERQTDVPCGDTANVAQNADAPQACGASVGEVNGDRAELVVPDEILRRADEYAEILSAVPAIMDACIARYKKKLIDARMGFASPAGAAVIVPTARPKTLSDAKRLADDLLNL